MDTVRPVLLVLAKDLRLRLRDRSVLLFAFVVPLGLTVVFSFIFPDIEELDVQATVVDADGGPIGAGFVDGVVPAIAAEDFVTITEVADEQAARDAVADGSLSVAWIIPAGTSEAVTAGQGAEITVLVADGRTLAGEIGRGVATAYAAQVEEIGLAVVTAATATGAEPDAGLVEAIAAAAPGAPPAATLVDRQSDAGEGLDATSYLAAGMAAFFVFFTVQFGVSGLLEERQLGTMPRLLAAPVRPATVQLGKLAGAFLLGMASMTVLGLASNLLLGADWGPPVGVAILITALVLAALGVMALVGSFARTAEQAGNYQSTVAVVLGLFGGVFFPLPGDGGLLRLATAASPHGWFLRGMEDLASTGDVAAAVPAAGAILVFAVVAAVPAVVLQRRSAAW